MNSRRDVCCCISGLEFQAGLDESAGESCDITDTDELRPVGDALRS